MVRRHISDDVKEMAFSMSLKGMSDSNIRQLTGVSERSLKRLRSTYRKTGYVSVKPFATGRPRLLTSMEVKVCHASLEILSLSFSVWCGHSFFATALNASPTCLSRSFKQSSVKFVQLRLHYRPSPGPSNERVTP
jgi:hypothetical protein